MAEQLTPREGFLRSYSVFSDLRENRLPYLHGTEGNPKRGGHPINRTPLVLDDLDLATGAHVGSSFGPKEFPLINSAICLLTDITRDGHLSEDDPTVSCAPLSDLIVARFAGDPPTNSGNL